MVKADTLIIGGGLAGCVAAWHEVLHGRTAVLVDHAELSNCSRVAGGLVNPVTGKRFVLDPRFKTHWKESLAFYRRVEACLGEELFHPCPQWRIFQTEEERETWIQRARSGEMDEWAGPVLDESAFPRQMRAPFGGVEISGGGRLDIPAFIRRTKARVPWVDAVVDDAQILYRSDAVRFQQITARRAVLCRGYRETYSLFDPPETQFAKGEILLLDIPDFPSDHIVNKGLWLIPLGNGRWKAGATYEWNEISEEPTPAGKSLLLARLENTIRSTVRVVDQLAGVRPALRQREPIVRRHPDFPLGVLNGLGSKGALLSPSLIRHLLDELLS